MSLKLNAAMARNADKTSSIIRETGKYVGTITRAEKLLSEKGTEGVGFSFKTDDGESANYLDVYTTKADGKELWGASIVQAILCCTRVKTADEGKISFDWWDSSAREMIKAEADGYPALMWKRIGLILQKEIQSHYQTGADQERINIVRVFEASTGLTASEILEGKTSPEKIDAFMKTLTPVRDSRKKSAVQRMAAPVESGTKAADFDDDIPF